MRNLAGHDNADRYVALELHEAGLEIRVDPEQQGEVPTVLYGHLPGFTFTRAWYYWIAKGEVPLETARRLYDHPVGRKRVRVAGHCGCPAPEDPWVTHIAEDGRHVKVLGDHDREAFEKYERGELSELMAEHVERIRECNIFVDTPEERDALAVRAFVDSYHIDTQEGLNLFVEEVRRAG